MGAPRAAALRSSSMGKNKKHRQARGPIGVEAADVRAPLLCISLLHKKKNTSPHHPTDN
jgi:hypothetical protein